MTTIAEIPLHDPRDEARADDRRRLLQLLCLGLGPSISLVLAANGAGVLGDGGSVHALLLVIALAWLPHGVSFPHLLRQDELAQRARTRRAQRARRAGGQRDARGVLSASAHAAGSAQLAGTLLGAVVLAFLW